MSKSTPFTLKHLRYFTSLARHKHFGKAAEACFITQPTLSTAIKELEDTLGLALFERTKRRVFLTLDGENLLPHAQALLLQADEFMDLAQTRKGPLHYSLRLGVIPTIGPYLLPRIMAPLRQTFPDLTLYLKEDQTHRLLEDLHEGRLDLLILALPYQSEGIHHFIFHQDPFLVTVPKGHPLSHKDHIAQNDLQGESLLLLSEGHCLRDHALAACALTSYQENNEFAATSLSTIVQMVAGHLGITLLPKLALEGGVLTNTDLVTIPMAAGSTGRDIGLVWRQTSQRTADFQQLGQYLQDLLAP